MKAHRRAMTALTVAAVFGPGAAMAGPRLVEDRGCTIVQVQPGDTAWGLARAAGTDVAALVDWNPQIADLGRIYPGDEIAVGCAPPVPATPDVPVIRQESMPSTVHVVDVGVEWVEEGRVLAPGGVVAVLYQAGFRGNALITMAGICWAESGGKTFYDGPHSSDGVGDERMTNRTWGPSYGVCQVRALHAEQGTGSTRDADQLLDPFFNARSAFAISAGGENFRPWTCYGNGWWRRHAAVMRQAASDLGLLEEG